MGVNQYYDAMIEMEKQPRGFDDPKYVPPRGHDIEMSDHDRAHSGKPGSAVKHGQNALNKPGNQGSEHAYYHRLRNSLDRGLD